MFRKRFLRLRKKQEQQFVPLQTISTHDATVNEPLPCRTMEELSVLELLGLYDRATSARLINEGFTFQLDVNSEVDAISRKGELKSLRERIVSIEEDILHFTISHDGSCAAVVMKDAAVEIWERDAMEQDWFPFLGVRLAHMNLDNRFGDTVVKFFVGHEGQMEFVVIQPQANDVVVTRIDVNTGAVSDHPLPLTNKGKSLKAFKVSQDGQRGLIVFEDRTFEVLRLNDQDLKVGLAGRFSYPCFFDNFIEEHVEQTCIHISEDCRFLTTGWDFSRKRLITFSLDVGDARMQDEYVSNCRNLALSSTGFVSWMNNEWSRAIVHGRTPGLPRFLIYDTQRLHGAVLHSMHDTFDRSCNTSSLPFDWITEFHPERLSELPLFTLRILVSLQESMPDYKSLNVLRVQLDEGMVQRFVCKFGPNVANSPNTNEKSLLHYTIMQQKLDCAELLFKAAADNDIPIRLCWIDGDILGWSVERGSYQCLMLVLQKILEKSSTVEETSNVLSVHFDTLLKKFPHVVEDFLTNDKLCFEYGRFSVPMHVLAASRDKPIAMVTNCMDVWKAANSHEVKQFWTQNSKGLAWRLNDFSGLQATAVSKFICMDDIACHRHGDLLHKIVHSRLPVEAFGSQFIRTIVQWKWHTALKIKLFISGFLHLVAAVSFSVFASTYGLDDPEDDDRNKAPFRNFTTAAGNETAGEAEAELNELLETGVGDSDQQVSEDLGYTKTDDTDLIISRWSLRFAFCILCLVTLFGRVPFSRLLSALLHIPIVLVFVVVIFSSTNRPEIVFLTSIYCITLWISVLFYLQPFGTTGPLVSMIQYVIWDTMPFATLGILAIVGFGMAFYVVFNALFDGKDNGTFNTQPRAFETMFYAAFGEFDREVMLQSSKRYPFLSIWISILFVVFLFLGGIVLLSLLIAILGDTYDRVKMTERAELIKCRARVIGTRPIGIFKWFVTKFMDCLCGRGWCKVVTRTHHMRHVSGTLVRPRGKCFHFLVPAESISKSHPEAWPGKILASVRMIKTRLCENEDRSAKERKTLNDTITQIQQDVALQRRNVEAAHQSAERYERLADRIDGIDARLDNMENTLSLILHKLESSASPNSQE